jgi:hypothetical protein
MNDSTLFVGVESLVKKQNSRSLPLDMGERLEWLA